MENTIHSIGFGYLLIPSDIDLDVIQLFFPPGKSEGEFQKVHLKSKFLTNPLTSKQASFLKQDINSSKERSKTNDTTTSTEPTTSTSRLVLLSSLSTNQLNDGSYEIVPLLLPCQANDYHGINMYVDAYGKHKQLDLNSRASRISTSTIYGDAILSAVYDDEEQPFARQTLSLNTYQQLLKSPPRQDQEKDQEKKRSLTFSSFSCCSHCNRSNQILYNCARCKQVKYCNKDCQKHNWKFHKPNCKKQETVL